MDPILNCLLAVCCPPEKRVGVLRDWLVKNGVEDVAAHDCAELIIAHFDLAEAGTLQPLIQSVARLARGADYKDGN